MVETLPPGAHSRFKDQASGDNRLRAGHQTGEESLRGANVGLSAVAVSYSALTSRCTNLNSRTSRDVEFFQRPSTPCLNGRIRLKRERAPLGPCSALLGQLMLSHTMAGWGARSKLRLFAWLFEIRCGCGFVLCDGGWDDGLFEAIVRGVVHFGIFRRLIGDKVARGVDVAQSKGRLCWVTGCKVA